ncbi:MAG: YicC/YloC family endoribonuclease [Pirellulales bacterium]
MLLSMTGHGEARAQESGLAIAVEVRAINNKYFKLNVRAGDRYGSLEPQIEALVRQHIRRGTIQLGIWVDREPSADDFRLNEVVLASYRRQLASIEQHLRLTEPIRLESLLGLPGVVDERLAHRADVEADWPVIERVVRAALLNLEQMRRDEGQAMAADLRANRQAIARELEAIEARAPRVIEAYRGKLRERIQKWLAEFDVRLGEADLVREVGLFADRSDISEEIVRLRSHLGQFDDLLASAEPSGRKLEFLTQEMFRETNTIGSKANDADIARHVIEIKAAIERMREMIQNVE